jgi:uracil-DNA glycosylase family protein
VARPSLRTLADEARSCRACPLWEKTTQVVFGEGPARAQLLLVGEQPGNEEDQQGEPFVGPAGRILDEALVEAGIDRPTVYVTNAVKHFKWEPRGKRRIHKMPNRAEVVACHRWLDQELAVDPDVVVHMPSVGKGRSVPTDPEKPKPDESNDGKPRAPDEPVGEFGDDEQADEGGDSDPR